MCCPLFTFAVLLDLNGTLDSLKDTLAESRQQSKELEQLLRKQNNDSTTVPPLRRLGDGAKQVRRIHYCVSNCLLIKKYVTDSTCPRNATTNK